MKYQITVKAEEYGTIEVEAETIGQACEKALELEQEGLVVWGDREVEVY